MEQSEKKTEAKDERMLWIGCKTAKSSFTTNKKIKCILEIAAVITDKQLHVLAESDSYAIYQPEWLLERIKSP